ncbi:TonB-dependent receptor [Ferrimonas pelagia]|uniref:TonB-dependent receptor n=1 Tax=Ferrimonas pelagia TaxID=1177826 RepID=A0ABP9FCM7_9GAMM
MKSFAPLIALGLPVCALAAPPSIEDVIVIRGEQPTSQQMATTQYQIDRESIAQSGAVSLDQILRTVPGVNVRWGGEGTPRVDIRGYKTRHVTFLINGVPQNMAEDGQFDPSLIPASQIERVDVVTGGGSLLYGPGGNAGTINVITRRDSAGAHANIGYGNDDRWQAGVGVSGSTDSMSGSLNYQGYGDRGFRLSSDFEPGSQEDGGLRNNSDRETHALSGRLGWQAAADTRLALTANVATEEKGAPIKVNENKSEVSRVDDLTRYALQLSGDHRINQHHNLRGFAYVSEQEQTLGDYSDYTLAEKLSETDSRELNRGANVQWLFQQDAHLLTTSLMLDHQSWRSNFYELPGLTSGDGSGGGGGGGDGSGGGSGGDDDGAINTHQQTRSAVVEYQWQGTEQGVTLSGGAHDNTIDDKVRYSALASAYQMLGTQTKLSSSVARKIRYPDLSSLFEGSSANPDLVPETTFHAELGLDHRLGQANRLSASVFYSDVDNYIEKDEDGISKNFAHYRFIGVDTQWHNHSFDAVDLVLGYSYLDAEDREGELGRTALQYRPTHSIKASAVARLPWQLTARLDAQYLRDQVYYQKEEQFSIDNFSLVDISISQPLPWDGLSWQATITNLLDEDYVTSREAPRPGREWMLQLKAQF